MSSLAPTQTTYKAISGRRTLQRLRREAGYRSAKEFAEALGIPSSTYARYERAGDGADCGIPLPAAWQIADKLGCSIDLVVGHEDIDASKFTTMQERIDSLSRSSSEMLDDYLRFLEFRDKVTGTQALK
ncbi:helix-turn-helix domain-containing protein [uncultured Enorma sp.]|jgi:transcriptional regulator with XRE-family HTH domain|uniref:helix-turn-helix domain-containing protein n=1 Tax=uncultured Enorma sp. TaxID=1714346 RepID=UPI0025EA1627|nr:helix-turn-helix transcriptional regulator [uncultured Enorma sp.]